MDFLIPLPQTENGNFGMLKVVCKSSKMIRIIAIKSNITAPEVAMIFKENVYRNRELRSKTIFDSDNLFISEFWKALFKSLDTNLAPSTAYYPQNDGQSEMPTRK